MLKPELGEIPNDWQVEMKALNSHKLWPLFGTLCFRKLNSGELQVTDAERVLTTSG